MRQLISRLSPVVPLCFLAGCAVSDDEELKLSMQAIPALERELGGIYRDQAVQRYVSYVGMSTVRCTGREDFAWRFKVLDSDQINAFALPGGKIYITLGLLAKLENEAQLASILGHEIGHVVRGHPIQQLERTATLQDGAVAAMVAGSSGEGGISSSTAALRKYSRDQEKEADLMGLKYLVLQGYDPQASVRTMEILQGASGRECGAESLSTHPNRDDRLEYLQEAIERSYGRSMRGKTEADRFRRIVLGI